MPLYLSHIATDGQHPIDKEACLQSAASSAAAQRRKEPSVSGREGSASFSVPRPAVALSAPNLNLFREACLHRFLHRANRTSAIEPDSRAPPAAARFSLFFFYTSPSSRHKRRRRRSSAEALVRESAEEKKRAENCGHNNTHTNTEHKEAEKKSRHEITGNLQKQHGGRAKTTDGKEHQKGRIHCPFPLRYCFCFCPLALCVTFRPPSGVSLPFPPVLDSSPQPRSRQTVSCTSLSSRLARHPPPRSPSNLVHPRLSLSLS